MKINPVYNPACDIGEVEPFHYIDLKQVLHNGVLPAGSATTSLHNGLDSTDQIGFRVKDNFDVYEASRSVSARLEAQAKANTE